MSKKRLSRTLKDPDAKAGPRAAYRMPAPNDNVEAYGWQLRNIRHADPQSADKKDPDAGKSIFSAPQETMATMRNIGHEATFICPKYLQIMLDSSKEVREAAMNAAESRYTQEAIGRIQDAINKVFTETILPDIAKNFEAVSGMVAQFYAARLAHIKKFGVVRDDD
jgi:hypothetical protein